MPNLFKKVIITLASIASALFAPLNGECDPGYVQFLQKAESVPYTTPYDQRIKGLIKESPLDAKYRHTESQLASQANKTLPFCRLESLAEQLSGSIVLMPHMQAGKREPAYDWGKVLSQIAKSRKLTVILNDAPEWAMEVTKFINGNITDERDKENMRFYQSLRESNIRRINSGDGPLHEVLSLSAGGKYQDGLEQAAALAISKARRDSRTDRSNGIVLIHPDSSEIPIYTKVINNLRPNTGVVILCPYSNEAQGMAPKEVKPGLSGVIYIDSSGVCYK